MVLSAQVIPVFLESKALEFTASHNAGSGSVEEKSYFYDPSGKSSVYLRFAQSFKLLAGNTVYLDVTHSTESSTKSYDGEEDVTSAYTMYALAWRNNSLDGWQPLLGYSYSPHEKQEMHLTTGGVSMIRGRSELILGAYYMASVPTDGSRDDSGPSYSNYGIMFSSSVAY